MARAPVWSRTRLLALCLGTVAILMTSCAGGSFAIAQERRDVIDEKRDTAPPVRPPSVDGDEDDGDKDKDEDDIWVWIWGVLGELPPLPPPGEPPVSDPGTVDSSTPVSVASRPNPRRKRPARTRPPRPARAAGTPAPLGLIAGEFRDREVLVAMASGATEADDAALGQEIGLNVEVAFASDLLGLRIVRYRIPDARPLAQVLAALATNPRVVSAEPNYIFRGSANPMPAAPLVQYAPGKIGLGAAHQLARGKRVRIAVIDTGIDAAHPEIAGAVGDSFDALGRGPPGVEAHGTAIAGILAARVELKGVAPDASLLAARAFRGDARGTSEGDSMAVIKALEWAFKSGARVFNMSFAGPYDPLLRDAIVAADAEGGIFVAAAGNGGAAAAPAFPAALPQVIAVTATDSADLPYANANRGDYILLAAPGVDVLAPAPHASYEISSGTSLAAAHVSGVVALLLERDPALSRERVREILGSSARATNGSAADLGAGVLDAARAVEGAR